MNKNIRLREEGQFILMVAGGSLVLTIRSHRDNQEVCLFDEEISNLRDFLNSEVEVLGKLSKEKKRGE